MNYVIGANWKMHPRTFAEAKELARNVVVPEDTVEVVIFPPAVYLRELAVAFPHLMWGGQNVFWESEGAYTGEVSVGMMRDAGAHYVLVGHSERRSYFNETDEMVAKKASAALSKGFHVILAVGEHTKNDSDALVVESLKKSTDGIAAQDLARLTVAYEPVWALSTSEHRQDADPGYVEQVVEDLRQVLDVRYIYGGSVDGDNAHTYLSCQGISGALVGGASLRADSFSTIVRHAGSLS